MTYKEIQDDALERLNLTSTEARTRVKRYVNEWYRRILARLGMSRLRDSSSTTIPVVAGTAEYTVPVAKIAHLFDAASQTFLVERPLTWMRQIDPADTYTSSVAVAYAIRKVNAASVLVRLWPTPSANGTLKVDSSGLLTSLSNDGDIPTIPEDYHWLLSMAARVCEYEKLDDNRFETARRDLEEGISELRYHLRKSHTAQFTGSEPGSKTSRLSPWYTE